MNGREAAHSYTPNQDLLLGVMLFQTAERVYNVHICIGWGGTQIENQTAERVYNVHICIGYPDRKGKSKSLHPAVFSEHSLKGTM